jgi:hypothetical protein
MTLNTTEAMYYTSTCVSWLSFNSPKITNSSLLNLANDFKTGLETYLTELEVSKVRTLEDIIDFNAKNSEKELPPDNLKLLLIDKYPC